MILFAFILLLASSANSYNEFLDDGKKIAFLFLVRGHMPLEDVWREFFTWKANSSHYSIYVNPHPGFKYHRSSFFFGKEVRRPSTVKWGGMSQVRAIKNLVREALEDPSNAWFVHMSESCIPVHPFHQWRSAFSKQNKSIVNACFMNPSEMETDTRWRPSLDKVGLTKDKWRKSATWFALNRKHAEVFVNETAMEKAWEPVPCCDEHYLPTTLAYNGLDNETTCTDGFSHVVWDSLTASHPHVHGAEEINAQLFAQFNKAVGQGVGFSQLCSGNPDLCHFTARKFSGAVRFSLLENMDLILSTVDVPYNGNPWRHLNELLYIYNETSYYLIENGQLRLVPDEITLNYMHLNASNAKSLSQTAKEKAAFGGPYPSRKDGLLVKAPKRNQVFVTKDGKRHGVPNMETLSSIGESLSRLTIVSDMDLEQIPVGDPIPDVKGKK